MKSAYELAMEKLEKETPVAKISNDQKARIAVVNDKYNAKIAERETFLTSKIAEAVLAGDYEEAAEMKQGLARDLRTLRDEMESKKEKIRNEDAQ